ncbi:hypothetical protein PoB_006630900 [Plakobranchus ocellatus]|uniref:Uncharacterized protein n=1 Tax=Plakobranchus ocellatus TaxID=259542 RepID=A0AAV4D6I0_9GAST|nr:hypothetical protein PoB_006630900 [Plakobranchus ocellatus]
MDSKPTLKCAGTHLSEFKFSMETLVRKEPPVHNKVTSSFQAYQSSQGAGDKVRTRVRRVPADLRADSLSTVLPTSLSVTSGVTLACFTATTAVDDWWCNDSELTLKYCRNFSVVGSSSKLLASSWPRKRLKT